MKIEAGSSRQSAALLLFCLSLVIVYAAGCRTRETSFTSPEDAAHVLENCAPDTCTQLSGSLHLAFPLRPPVCSVGVLRGSFEADSDDAVLKVQCSQDFQLLLLSRKSRGRWQYADSIPFPFGNHDLIAVALQKLIDPNDDDIVIHGDTVAFGTGIYQADFLVLRVLNRKLRVVLDTVEKGSVYPPLGHGTAVQQQSSFSITPTTGRDPGSITERMDLNVGGKKVTVERDFYWQKDLGIFEPGFWSRPDEPDAAK